MGGKCSSGPSPEIGSAARFKLSKTWGEGKASHTALSRSVGLGRLLGL